MLGYSHSLPSPSTSPRFLSSFRHSFFSKISQTRAGSCHWGGKRGSVGRTECHHVVRSWNILTNSWMRTGSCHRTWLFFSLVYAWNFHPRSARQSQSLSGRFDACPNSQSRCYPASSRYGRSPTRARNEDVWLVWRPACSRSRDWIYHLGTDLSVFSGLGQELRGWSLMSKAPPCTKEALENQYFL